MSTPPESGGRLRVWSQLAARCIRATESPPPETASANGALKGEPKRSSAAANRRCSAPASASASAAHGVAAFGAGARRDRGACLRVFRRERGKGGTAFIHLAQLEQRQTELEHAVGGARGVRVFLQQLGEIARGSFVILLGGEGDVAGPIERG